MQENDIMQRFGYGFSNCFTRAYAYPVKFDGKHFELFEYALEDQGYVLIKSDATFDECQKWISEIRKQKSPVCGRGEKGK